jgi:Uma2 family endonuclease
LTIASPPTSIPPPAGDRPEPILLTGISWDTYRRLRTECDRGHVKMTYDRGALEIMPPRADHSMVTRFIDQMITVTCEELHIELAGYRDTTWQKEAADRGLEADDCYYIQHVQVANERGADINVERDPPPDLAVETDITHSTIDKEAVYSGLGVPELWRWDDGRLRVRLLGPDGLYADADRSRALPMLPPHVVEGFVRRRWRGEGESKLKTEFRGWVRANLRT